MQAGPIDCLSGYRIAGDIGRVGFAKTPVLEDYRIVCMFEEIAQMDVPLGQRTGNWGQEYFTDSDVLAYVDAQLADLERVQTMLAQ